MSKWVASCEERYRFDVGRVVSSLDPTAELVFTRTSDGLRSLVMGSVPGELSVVVGPQEDGVSDINLAAALAHDGNAHRVVLAREGLSGSLRSRAARAGIDVVVDLGELAGKEGGDMSDAKSVGDDRSSGVPSPSFPPADCVANTGLDAGSNSSMARSTVTGPSASVGQRSAPILVFCSGRGGVGKTSLVAAAAVHAASWGMRVVAVDLDLSCGNLYSCFGLPHGSDLARLAQQDGTGAGIVDGVCVAAASNVRLAGPCERPEASELALPGLGTLLDQAARQSDVVLVDTSTTFTDAVAQAAQMADRLVLVSDGRAGSVAALARSSGLAVRLRVARTRIARLENRASTRSKANFALGRAEVGLEAARVFRAFEGGDEVSALLGEGHATELVDSGMPFAESVATVLAQLLEELGRLPSCEAARRAAEGSTTRRLPSLFGRMREAR